MNRLDHLRELLNERADATSVIERDLGDVHRRARRHHKPSALAGALTSIAVAATVALVVAAIGVEHSDSRQQVTSSSVDGNAYGPTSSQAISFTRDLAGGVLLHASIPTPIVAFGPYGPGEQWVEPLSCPVGVDVSFAAPGGSEEVVTVDGVSRADQAQMSLAAWQGPDPTTTGSGTPTRTDVVVISHPTAGATYRMLSGNTVLDHAAARGPLLVLVGSQPGDPGATSATVAPDDVGGIHVQQLDGTQLVDDQPVRPPIDSTEPAGCTPPPDPAGLTSAVVLDTTDTAAITSVVASLFPPGGTLVDGLAHVEDPHGTIRSFLTGLQPQALDLLVSAQDIYPVSATQAWVRYGVRIGTDPAASPAPAESTGWIRVDQVDGAWTATTDSFCALVTTLDVRCPGAPAYTPLAGSGQAFHSPDGDGSTTTAG